MATIVFELSDNVKNAMTAKAEIIMTNMLKNSAHGSFPFQKMELIFLCFFAKMHAVSRSLDKNQGYSDITSIFLISILEMCE